MAKAKSNESARDVGAKPAFGSRAWAWPASSRCFRQVQTLRQTQGLLPPQLLSGQVELAQSNGTETNL